MDSMATQHKRPDGRAVGDIRPLSIVYEGLNRVDGSARFGFGQTQSFASISGPIEVRPNHELPSQATLEINIRPLASVPGTDSRALATTLKSILTPALFLSHLPRTLVQIVGQALCGTDTGSGLGSVGRGWSAPLVASLVNACSAALLNAGSVPMKGVICAVAVGRIVSPSSPSGFATILDPSEAETPNLVGGGCFVFMFSSTLSSTPTQDSLPFSLVWTNYIATTGAFGEDEFSQARAAALNGAQQIWKALKASISGEVELLPNAAVKQEAQQNVVLEEEEDEKMEI